MRGPAGRGAAIQPVGYLLSTVLKPAKVRLIGAIAAQHGAKMYKTDTTQAFLYGDVEEELFVRAPDWWQELVPEGHCLQLKKNIYWTWQAACAWHLCISGWMESHGYPATNSEKTMFRKQDGDDFIHWLSVDDAHCRVPADLAEIPQP